VWRLSALTGRMATTPSTLAFLYQTIARSGSRSSSFGAIRYVATPSMPRAVSSRTKASSPEIRSDSSCEMMSAATFLPAKLTALASGDFHVDVNFTAAADSTTPSATVAAHPIVKCFNSIVFSMERFYTCRVAKGEGRKMMARLLVLVMSFVLGTHAAWAQSNPTYVQFENFTVKGVLYQPDSGEPHVAVLLIHRVNNYLGHIAARELARRGFLVLAMNSRFDNNEASVIWEAIALDVKEGVEFLRKRPGIRKVVL